MSDVLWRPSAQRAAATHLAAFAGQVPDTPEAYGELWRWSIDDPEGFWARVWSYCDVRVLDADYEQVVGELRMPGTEWFRGAGLNYAGNLLREPGDSLAVFAAGEGRDDQRITRGDLARLVARAQRGLAALGVERGDRVAAIVPNCVEALVLMLATTSLGAIWSSCSPDFGPQGIVDRFRQIRPKVLVAADGYRYGGQVYPSAEKLAAVLAEVEVRHAVVFDYVGTGATGYADLLEDDAGAPVFASLPFAAPAFVLYSSGTTGVPKSIVHGGGGTLLQHLKEHQLHADVHPGDVVFWFTTCGWMMWNWLVSALASQATLVLYDGSPVYPDPGVLWRLAERAGVTHFGTSPRYLAGLQKQKARPRELADLSSVSTVLSTGAPLNPEQFDYVYDAVAPDAALWSVSGGTDIVGCFAGGVPTLPVRRGRLRGRALGMAVEAYDLRGEPVVGEKGELVCTRPHPSMPLYFWGDADGSSYRAAYFDRWPGVWTHGDFIQIDPDGSVVIFGRSDTTLNPGGVRIGTAEIYRAIEPLPEVADAIVVGRPFEGDVVIVLCVVPAQGVTLDEDAVARIKDAIRTATSPRHVPRHVFEVGEIPYTISGKKVEKAVLSMMTGQPVGNRDALLNPSALDEYARLPF
jgi:acetoacetyl-CoA synthetase